MIPLSIFSVDLLSDNLLLLVSVLVFFGILVTKMGRRLGAPSLLLFLLLGMVVGADGLGVKFEDYEIAESIGHFAMTIILFTGGLETSLAETRPVMKQSITLSTLGVFLTVLFTGLFIYFVAWRFLSMTEASILGCFLLAAIMSSTDSTSVFSVLRGKRLHLRENLGPLLELESGSNDPMAYVLTIVLVQVLSIAKSGAAGPWNLFWNGVLVFVLQIAVGFAVGFAVGYCAKWIFKKIHLDNASLYSILVLSIGFFANGLAWLLHGNGLLALYVAALLISNKAEIPHKRDVLKFFDGITWLMQLLMFLMLGLLARPSQMLPVVVPALIIGLFMMLIARPASVLLCLAPFRKMSFKAKVLVSWVGLKGAGPILFALYPVVVGLNGASEIFNVVVFISILSLLAKGMTFTGTAKYLKLSYDEDPEVESFGMEIPEEMGLLRDHTVSVEDLSRGKTLRDLNLPHGIRVIMVRRDGRFLVPHGSMELFEGDHLVILMGESDD